MKEAFIKNIGAPKNTFNEKIGALRKAGNQKILNALNI